MRYVLCLGAIALDDALHLLLGGAQPLAEFAGERFDEGVHGGRGLDCNADGTL